METMKELLGSHPFFAGLSPARWNSSQGARPMCTSLKATVSSMRENLPASFT